MGVKIVSCADRIKKHLLHETCNIYNKFEFCKKGINMIIKFSKFTMRIVLFAEFVAAQYL